MAKRKWIQKTGIKKKGRKGSLTSWAKKHHFISKSTGDIKLKEAYGYAKRHDLTHRMRQINLAKTLRKMKKR